MSERKYAIGPARFGFGNTKGGVHSRRTMMLTELQTLLASVNNPTARKGDYRQAIEVDNSLGKRSGKSRSLTFEYLAHLYGLDPGIVTFRALLFFWQRDPQGQPLLALLAAYIRDPILRSGVPFVLDQPEGSAIAREAFEEFLENKEPGRFSKETLKSNAGHITSTMTLTGHLAGRTRRVRSRAMPTPGAVAYALLLGYLSGLRGESLLRSEYMILLDCNFEQAVELAEDASRRGWIVFKRLGAVVEILFPNLITPQEMEWLREQG